MKTTYYSFIKIFENLNHAERFIEGQLHMKKVRYFQEYKDKNGELRGDKYEGVKSILHPKNMKDVYIDDKKIVDSKSLDPLITYDNNTLNKNAYCMYSLSSKGFTSISSENINEFKKALEIHEKCFGLGSHCVVIKNITEFIKRIKKSLTKVNLGYKIRPVEYFNERDINGYLPSKDLGFQKRNMFSIQNEYRILLDRAEEGPYNLEIGNISDIAVIMKPQDVNKGLKVILPNGHTS